ncbi:hypothetical protein T265_01435 [Opisthorchis viverrini]|uniref:Uncharacterized protein n=1 Tax=Opisthorchis viverrini TaxID=6198 RepID=A0A074ZYM4_OPIVI|nr:hypothetical protein T265_01435 [Opisthorchis viverrini]KER32563.1 hypothetical protein T265_01435 [Opisthorchis viverrini]
MLDRLAQAVTVSVDELAVLSNLTALRLPSDGIASGHRKGVTTERFFPAHLIKQYIAFVTNGWSITSAVPHAEMLLDRTKTMALRDLRISNKEGVLYHPVYSLQDNEASTGKDREKPKHGFKHTLIITEQFGELALRTGAGDRILGVLTETLEVVNESAHYAHAVPGRQKQGRKYDCYQHEIVTGSSGALTGGC